ncbi:hypothetical protein L915_12404 [Phytophthora nicotianae]|uniref:Transmembrane protein n=1 Tax=Phytophthora nicotianae TaxID=4792 RepID=W2GIX3_PHYNI|nr:hypothetical protein L915_12404 [Phytophthora nicotianae]
MSKSAAGYSRAQDRTAMPSKRVPTLPVITIVPDANPTCPVRRGPAQHQAQNSSRSTWNSSFFDCCCSVAPTYCCIVTCCPCTTIASVKESLSGGYERTLLYFGGLALGFLVSVGFAASNTSNTSEDTEDIPVGPGPPSPSESPQDGDSGHSIMWQAFAALFLITFLLGVWRLRMQTRHSLGWANRWICVSCAATGYGKNRRYRPVYRRRDLFDAAEHTTTPPQTSMQEEERALKG